MTARAAGMQSMPAAAVRVRIELIWGRGDDTVWDGNLSIDDGRILAVETPQLEPDETAMNVNATRLGWTSRTTGPIGGVNVMLDATVDSRITIETSVGK